MFSISSLRASINFIKRNLDGSTSQRANKVFQLNGEHRTDTINGPCGVFFIRREMLLCSLEAEDSHEALTDPPDSGRNVVSRDAKMKILVQVEVSLVVLLH
jgi:hypothetical protein